MMIEERHRETEERLSLYRDRRSTDSGLAIRALHCCAKHITMSRFSGVICVRDTGNHPNELVPEPIQKHYPEGEIMRAHGRV